MTNIDTPWREIPIDTTNCHYAIMACKELSDTIVDLTAALEAAYKFISQPQRMTRVVATYPIHNYNALTAQIRGALAAARKTP